MASHILSRLLAPAVSSPEVPELSVLEALSGISGSISLVAWIVLLLPQLIENYKNGRADALSVTFLLVWLVGDLANVTGAIWGGLLPTVVVLAVYYCFADIVLLAQTIYYNHVTAKHEKDESRRRSEGGQPSDDSTTPLLGQQRRRSSVLSRHRRNSAYRADSLSSMLRDSNQPYAEVVRNTLCILGVIAAGTLGWFIAWKSGAWVPQPDSADDVDMPLGANIMGYISAFMYLIARLPQIFKNWRDKSCEGLSLLFFMLSLMGNLSYGAGILFHSVRPQYVVDNIPWLLGSLGTMAEDVFIFIQFHIYSQRSGSDSTSAVA